jgi:hypothetical protein
MLLNYATNLGNTIYEGDTVLCIRIIAKNVLIDGCSHQAWDAGLAEWESRFVAADSDSE